MCGVYVIAGTYGTKTVDPFTQKISRLMSQEEVAQHAYNLNPREKTSTLAEASPQNVLDFQGR